MKRETRKRPLNREVMEFLRREGRESFHEAGDIIVRRGDPGAAFCVILEGKAEVRLAGEGGLALPLSRLSEGCFFGEMALLTGEPASADVIARSRVRLLVYPGERFARAMGECAPLREEILAGLARNLRGTNKDVWNFFQRAQVLDLLAEGGVHAGPLIAESPAMAKVAAQVSALAESDAPMLIDGEAGTGKVFLAAKIHEAGSVSGRPFIVVDCGELDALEADRRLFGSLRFECQNGETGEGPELQSFGALHVANGGTLVLRNVECLDERQQESLDSYLESVAAGRVDFPLARLVGTSRGNIGELAEKGLFNPALARKLTSRRLTVPRLVQRRQDVILLARQFLRELAGGRETYELGEDAERALASNRFSHENAAELREAMDMAVLVSEGSVILAEHIFSGPKGEGTSIELDLSRFPQVERLITPRVHAVIRAGVFAAFSGIILVTLLLGQSAGGRVANSLVWGLWWPLLMVLFLLMGRVWCSVCPLSSAARTVRRIHELGLPPAEWLKQWSGWLITGGFSVIIWVEHAFHMIDRPRATGTLLLSLMTLATLSALVFKRETWCRYLCPLGGLGAIYSLPAMLNVRANSGVCATYCTTHECFKGTGDQEGCPVFLHPLFAKDSLYCKLCFTCLRICPHGSARLYLRAPFQAVWRLGDMGPVLVPFALFFFFISLFLLGSRNLEAASSLPGFSTVIVLALVLTVVAVRLLPRLLSTEKDPEPALAARVAFSLLVLAWGPAMAFHLEVLPGAGYLSLGALNGSPLARVLPPGGVPLIFLLQLGAILLAAAITGLILWRVRSRLLKEGTDISLRGWAFLLALCHLYLGASVAMVLPVGAG